MKRNAIITVMMTLGTLLAIEAGFRVVARLRPPPRWIAIDRYPANPRGYFRPCGDGEFCPDLDRDGAHGCEAPVVPGKSQVLFVGDSFTFGQGVDAVDTYPSRIDFPDDQRRNCAVSGSDVTMVHDAVVRLTERYHPRLVVYGMVLNDFGLDMAPTPEFSDVGGAQMIADFMNVHTQSLDEFIASRRHGALAGALLASSETAHWFYRTWVMGRISQLTLDAYRRAFDGPSAKAKFELIRDMAKRSPRFLVVLFPLFIDFHHYPLQELHQQIRRELPGIEVLDLYDTYRGRDASQLMVFPTDQHPNEEAHRLAATAVRERLHTLGWDRDAR